MDVGDGCFLLSLSVTHHKEKKINLFDYGRIKHRKKLSDKRSRGFQCLYASYHDKMDCSFMNSMILMGIESLFLSKAKNLRERSIMMLIR